MAALELPAGIRLEVEAPGGRRYPARIERRHVVAACGAVGKSVPVVASPTRALDDNEWWQARGFVILLRSIGGYYRARWEAEVEGEPAAEMAPGPIGVCPACGRPL